MPVRAVHYQSGRNQIRVDSSLGVRPDYRPSSDIATGCPLQRGPKPSLRREPYHSSRSFRPCRSSRLRRFSPPDDSRVCCTPQPDLGFAMFRACLPKQDRRSRWRPPFEAFPSSAAGVATPYPLVVRPEPCCHVSHPDLRVFNPPMNPLQSPRSCLHGAARCFLGLASLECAPVSRPSGRDEPPIAGGPVGVPRSGSGTPRSWDRRDVAVRTRNSANRAA